MVYRIEFAPRAVRAISEQLQHSVAVACVEFIYGPLAENPHRVGKQLRNELSGRYSARRGDFRVIYEVHDSTVTVRVIDARHRRDVYS